MLKRVPDASRPQSVFDLFLCRGVENVTRALRKGDPFSAAALQDMQTFRARYGAFCDALDYRLEEDQRQREASK